jgi:CzcA family heavy metal efflux pump
VSWLVGAALQFRFLVASLAAATIVVGVAQLRHMPVDVLPEFAPPYIEVQTEALGLSAAEVESLISVNLEELLNGTPWLKTISSRSVPGLSSVTLVFEPGTDVIRARQLVAERLQLAYTLPNVSQAPVILQPLSATSRVMMVGLSSKDVPMIQMGVLARWNLRPALMSVPGVANVSVWGQRERQLQVQVNPDVLRTYDVTLDQIVEAAGDAVWVSPLSFLNASTPGSGGWIDTPQQRLEVRHLLPITRAEDLAKVPVSGTNLQIGDVATVVEDHQPLIGDAILKDGAGLLLVIEKFPGANTLEVTRGVDAKLLELAPGLTGISVDTGVFRPADFIEQGIGNLGLVLIIGALLMALVLGVLLWEWRLLLISAVVVPLSVVVASLVLLVTGATMNEMLLAGLVIAIGVIVDDAVVNLDAVAARYRNPGPDDSAPLGQVVLDATLSMRGPLFYATFIMLLAIAPLFLLQGTSGAFFQPLAIAYGLALVASLVVALTVTPALTVIVLSRTPLKRGDAPLLRWLRRGYDVLLARLLGTFRVTAISSAGITLAGLLMLPFLQLSLLPTFHEPQVVVRWDGAPGTSQPEMFRLASQVGRELQSVSGVRNVGAHIGRAVLGDQVVGMNSGEMWVSIDRTADYFATQEAVSEVVDGYPGLASEVETYLNDRVRQVLAGSSDDIVVRIFGPEWDPLKAKTDEVRKAVSMIPGVSAVHAELQIEEPQLQIEVDLAKAERYGLKPGDVRRAASTYLAGLNVGVLFEEQKVFDVVVWGTPETRDSLTTVRELMIDAPNGGHVRLEDVASVRLASTVNMVNRDAVSRRLDVGLSVSGRDAAAVVSDVQAALARISFPLEYHAEVLGEYAERQAAQAQLLGFALAAMAVIFLLLQAAFGSWRLAAISLLTLPMALVGGVVAAFLGGGILSIGSLVGFVTVLGIAARNGIMLINHYQHLERVEGEPFGPGLVLRGARERMSPILMTAAALAAALLPLVIAGEAAGLEMVRPMAVVILGGLVTSTLLSLFVLPAVYLQLGQWPAHHRSTAQPTEG